MPAPNVTVPGMADLQSQAVTIADTIAANTTQIAELQSDNEQLQIQQNWITGILEYMQALTQLITPENFTATPGTNEMELAWGNDPLADTYTVERATSSDFTTDIATAYSGVYPTTYTDTGLTSGATYYYRIKSTAPDLDDSEYAYADGVAL